MTTNNNTRIYLVGNGVTKSRLVRAASQAQALMHVARAEFPHLRVATTDDVASLVADGVRVEECVPRRGEE